MNKTWTDLDKLFVRVNALTMKDEDIARALTESTGRNVKTQSVRKQRQKMGIFKASGRGLCAARPSNKMSGEQPSG